MGPERDRQAVVGLDLGGTNLRVAGIDRRGKVISLYREETKASLGPEAVVERLIDGLRGVVTVLRASGWAVLGASLGIPGVISRRSGTVASSPNLPGWSNVPLLKLVRSKFEFPLIMENDANAAVYGEFWAGAGRERNNFVLMTLGTGVGGGLIINGELVRGADGMAGEIGHLTVEREGEPCPCGNRGCLERYASATGIIGRYRHLAAGEAEVRSPSPGTESLTAAGLHRMALEGDALARQAFREAGLYLGIAMASIVNIINPEAIIIGGGVLPAWDLIMPAAREEMLCRAFQDPAERVELVPAELGDQAGFIGAAGLLWREIEDRSLTGRGESFQ